MQNIIETFALTKRFSKATNYRALFRLNRQDDFTAVDAIHLQVKEGELFGLLGANGAGKTTLIKMLCTLVIPSEGDAQVAGHSIVTAPNEVRRSIGLVDTHERSFFWRLSGRQNLEFFAALYGLYDKPAQQRIEELIELVDLGEHADQRFMGYSSGMKQKLAVARGLLTVPRVLFLDEPTRSLDPVSAQELRLFIHQKLVQELGHTVVLVTHRLEEAEELCDRVAIMKQGHILACGPIDEIKQHVTMQQEYYLRVKNLPQTALISMAELPGVTTLTHHIDPHGLISLKITLLDETTTLPLILAQIMEHGGQIQHCDALKVSLQDAFVKLVKPNVA